MMDKRLLGIVPQSKKYIAGNVICQWISLLANIGMMYAITRLLAGIFERSAGWGQMYKTMAVVVMAVVIRYACTIGAGRCSYLSSKEVKQVLREKIYGKLLRIGASYRDSVTTSEVVQVSVEGVDQLETYFGAYLPQFFYAMLAPLTLFFVLVFVNVPAAVVLLVCVPLIPVSIALVQTWAKKLLSKYWGRYTALGDTFLENLQGLTTLKIYQSDAYKNEKMNEESEEFRKITMKVLSMQLNSITIMDFIAYGGAAIGMIVAIIQFQKGNIALSGCLLIILLAADFFLPMRTLGSFFHIAMNGMAASDKIFRLLGLPEQESGKMNCPTGGIEVSHLSYSYEKEREILKDVNLTFASGKFTAIVGASGCGKSTIAGILMSRNKNYGGSVKIGGVELRDLSEQSLMEHLTYISHRSFLFKGTVRDNLLAARPLASDEELWEVLRKVNLAGFLMENQGLDTRLSENGSNLSGGQCQRLALARALLHDSPVYVFDEATSNIDVESENDIMRQVYELARTKTVILISHRLKNIENADCIYVMQDGRVAEQGTKEELLLKKGVFEKLWTAQQELETFTGEECEAV